MKMNINLSLTPKANYIKYLFLVIIGILLIAMPFISSQYLLRIIIMAGLYLILALSLNFITGYMGEISMGHAAFYAIGAYCSAIFAKTFGMNYFLAALIASCIAGFFGLLMALPALRTSGINLAFITLAFLEIIRMIIRNWTPVTGGALGLNDIPRPVLFGITLNLKNGGFYYLVLVYVLLTMLVTYLVINSKTGRAIKSIREDELAAKLMGIKTYKYKIITFVISAFFAGLAGSVYAHLMGYITYQSFTYDMSMTILSIVILGGMGTTKGMIIGTILIAPLSEVLRSLTSAMGSWGALQVIPNPEQWTFVIYGVIMVLMMLFRPQGLLGGLSKAPYKMPKGIIRAGEKNGAIGS